MKIYKLEVIALPTNRPVNRLDHNDRIYRTTQNKYDMIVEELHEMHRRGRPNDPFLLSEVLNRLRPIVQNDPQLNDQQRQDNLSRLDEALQQFKKADNDDTKVVHFMMETYDQLMGELATGRPILVGTTSVENSEKLSQLLERSYGIEHEVLNAKNHAREAEIVAKAGQRYEPTRGSDKQPLGNVTIATNMAGRGTDIRLEEGVVYGKCKTPENVREIVPDYSAESLNLYPIGMTKCCIHCSEYDPKTKCSHCFKPKVDPRFPELGKKVCSLNSPCGLHIVGTERHESRRVDNQLRGRAGRQGDPGSSRFFLSLEDDLLKLFMPEFMMKWMERLGFTEGVSLEDKRITKGIERAQKKVEERNFGIRKHLLEWDEPMDYQRRAFYSERQRILEGRELSELIWRMIEETVDEATSDYLAPDYTARMVSEWCKNTLDIPVDPEFLDDDDPDYLAKRIRQKAKDEIRDSVRTSLIEYIDEEQPPSSWDVGGLLKWAQRQFPISVTQNQLRKMSPDEIEELLVQIADEHYEQVDLSPIEVYTDPMYARGALAEWARVKFGIQIKSDEIAEGDADHVRNVIFQKVKDAYARRELRYPIDTVISQAFSSSGTDYHFARQQIAAWANSKYRLGWDADQMADWTPEQIARKLEDATRSFLDAGLQQEIDQAIQKHDPHANGELLAWAQERFGKTVDPEVLKSQPGQAREILEHAGHELARWELTQLERHLLLRIYDQGWKDHLLEMDHLRSAIQQRPLGGDQTHPQSQYAIEGRDQFQQMWKTIRERITDMLFKISAGQGSQSSETSTMGTDGAQLEVRHDSASGAGFSGAGQDQASQEAAMRAQGEASKPKTIKREQPKVGRNDPCPCGSGKKYKQCHGKQP
jgi:preprotein translocase subunit SecA